MTTNEVVIGINTKHSQNVDVIIYSCLCTNAHWTQSFFLCFLLSHTMPTSVLSSCDQGIKTRLLGYIPSKELHTGMTFKYTWKLFSLARLASPNWAKANTKIVLHTTTHPTIGCDDFLNISRINLAKVYMHD